MSKQYRLLKDLPHCPKGMIFEQEEITGAYFSEKEIPIGNHHMYFNYKLVESTPDWFEEVKPEPTGFSLIVRKEMDRIMGLIERQTKDMYDMLVAKSSGPVVNKDGAKFIECSVKVGTIIRYATEKDLDRLGRTAMVTAFSIPDDKVWVGGEVLTIGEYLGRIESGRYEIVNSFEWTDDLVREYATELLNYPLLYRLTIEEFKKSKQ